MPANNPFKYHAVGSESPAMDLVAITPHDTNDLTNVARDIRVGGDGAVVVVTSAGTEITFNNCVAGEHLGPFCDVR